MKTENHSQMACIYESMLILLKAELKQGNIRNIGALKAVNAKLFYCYENNGLSLQDSISSKKSLSSQYIQIPSTRRYTLNPSWYGTSGIGMYYQDEDMS